jgi:hypothetical protein
MEFRELRMMAIRGELEGHHQVWRFGSDDRQEASSMVGLIPPEKKDPESPPPSDLSDDDPYATPKVRTIAEGPLGGLYLPHLGQTNFPVFLGVLAITVTLFYLAGLASDPDIIPVLYSLAVISLLIWIFLASVFLHRAWEMMRMFGAPIDGSKAVRFFFLPVFNALWCFVILFGWSRLWNRNVKTHPGLAPAKEVWRPLFFAFPILFLISQTLLIMHFFINEWPTDLSNQHHQISLLLWTATLVVGLICWFQLGQSINFLARKKS